MSNVIAQMNTIRSVFRGHL